MHYEKVEMINFCLKSHVYKENLANIKTKLKYIF